MSGTPEIYKLEDGQIEISTTRLILRGARAEDVQSLHEAFSDPEVMKYWYVIRYFPFCFLFDGMTKKALWTSPSLEFLARLMLNTMYRSTTPHTSIQETSSWFEKMITSPQNGTTDFIIVHKATPLESSCQALPATGAQPQHQTAIGKIGVWQAQEIGFLLSRSYWGKGLAEEALTAALVYLFRREQSFDEITADVDPRNERSLKLLQRMGFEVTGFKDRTWEIGGQWVDSVYLGLKRDEWETKGQEKVERGS